MQFHLLGIIDFLVLMGKNCLNFWQVVADLHMPMLFVRYCDSGAGVGVGQGTNSCHGVVYFSDSMLAFNLYCCLVSYLLACSVVVGSKVIVWYYGLWLWFYLKSWQGDCASFGFLDLSDITCTWMDCGRVNYQLIQNYSMAQICSLIFFWKKWEETLNELWSMRPIVCRWTFTLKAILYNDGLQFLGSWHEKYKRPWYLLPLLTKLCFDLSKLNTPCIF